MAALDPIRRQKLYQEIARRLESQILDRRLQPDDALPSERELMKRHGVGRPAVREALLLLQKSGLIAVQNGERARVVRPSAMSLVGELGDAARYLLSQTDGVRQFQQARLFFEVGLVRFAAEHGTEADVARLARALAANEAALADMESFAQTDVESRRETRMGSRRRCGNISGMSRSFIGASGLPTRHAETPAPTRR